VPAVVADDHAAALGDLRHLREQVLTEPPARAQHDSAVHPALAAAEQAAQARGPELERPHEALGELGLRLGGASLRGLEQRRELGAGHGIGVVGNPGLDAGEEGCGCVHAPIFITNSAARARYFFALSLARASAKSVS
jgi:hypothetical protein